MIRERLDRPIADAVEESLALEYKRAGAVTNTNPNKVEITKDVSDFADAQATIPRWRVGCGLETSRRDKGN